jgi:hypothetical protein
MAAWTALPFYQATGQPPADRLCPVARGQGEVNDRWALSSAGIETPSDPLATAACCRRTARLLPIRS